MYTNDLPLMIGASSASWDDDGSFFLVCLDFGA